jgi:PAS domain S-box-containing protein
MDVAQLAHRSWSIAGATAGFDLLFEHLADICFFVKDARGYFLRANGAFIKLVQGTNEADVVGKCDHDFFPQALAQNYARDDQTVLESGQPLVEKAELVQHADGRIDWFCTTKLPMLNLQSRAVGVCGITRHLRPLSAMDAPQSAWELVVENLLNGYAAPLDTASLATLVGLSVSQFNRKFRQRFQTTPRSYLTHIRLDVAIHLLTTTELSMSEVALRTGFYDQSHFTNQFVKRHRLPPSKYRAQYGPSPRLGARLEARPSPSKGSTSGAQPA